MWEFSILNICQEEETLDYVGSLKLYFQLKVLSTFPAYWHVVNTLKWCSQVILWESVVWGYLDSDCREEVSPNGK